MITLTDKQLEILHEIIGMSQDYLKDGNTYIPRYLNRLVYCITDKTYKKIIGFEKRKEIRDYIHEHCFCEATQDDYDRWMKIIFSEDYNYDKDRI